MCWLNSIAPVFSMSYAGFVPSPIVQLLESGAIEDGGR
jgi:hypothetical protein